MRWSPSVRLVALPAAMWGACGDPGPAPRSEPAAEHAAERGADRAAQAAGPWSFGQALPGTDGIPVALAAKLEAAWVGRSAGYQPRTRHLRGTGVPMYTNRLFLEASPYLRQHAHNPVDWYPWGAEAFEAAARLGRPILLSVGYSTCHWCHVMEEQSFEDEEVARYINGHYIAIKVDREERPDVDGIYMAAVQQITGNGGWPMTLWLAPDRRPFFAGTYLPRDPFLRALHRLRAEYDRRPGEVAEQAAWVSAAVQRDLEPEVAGADLPDAAILHSAARIFTGRLDETSGGSVGLPKFPSGMPVRFLLRYHRRTGDRRALRASLLTLEKMAAGGIYDQIGGGFHRYSTDGAWRVPHFEKMLYDNALLVMAYAEAYQVTGREEFARVVRETLGWADRDMTAPGGGFCSASDADSRAPGGRLEEGRFFTWTPAELAAALGPARAAVAAAYYGVTEAGDLDGRSVLHVAGGGGVRPPELTLAVDLLHRERARRPPPLRDDKVLVDWNGLMISAHAQAALALREPAYAARAVRAAEALWTGARGEGGRLYHSAGAARSPAYMEDHAFLCAALLDLHEATADSRWLERAIDIDRAVERHFQDRETGGFFRTGDDQEALLARERSYYDGAIPTGASVHVRNLLRLHELTGADAYRQRAERALGHYGAVLRTVPSAMSEMLLAVDHYLDRPKQIVIVGRESRAEAAPFLAALSGVFVPNRALVVASQSEIAGLAPRIPLAAEKSAQGGRATAYVCEHGVCDLPTSDPIVFARQLQKVRPLAKPAHVAR